VFNADAGEGLSVLFTLRFLIVFLCFLCLDFSFGAFDRLGVSRASRVLAGLDMVRAFQEFKSGTLDYAETGSGNE